MAPIPRLKTYDGPVILSYGFRPFFLAGAIAAILGIAAWIPQYFGQIVLPNILPPPAWHAHEMLFGFIPAVITGFLLTAIPNWTGRLPLQGRPLLLLLLVWLAGRLAIGLTATIGWLPSMLIDCSYLLLLGLVIAREIIAGKNWRNLKVLAIVGLLFAADVAFHLEAHYTGAAQYSERAGVAAIVMLVILIGGRVVPSFTRNWLSRENPGRLPAPADRFDEALVTSAAIGAASWVLSPDSILSAALLLIAAGAQVIRLARWVGWRAWRDPLVLVMHGAYVFVPIGFVLDACAALRPEFAQPSAGIHAWTIGATSGMILAIMTRATLGHTGRALKATRATVVIYVSVAISAVARVGAALEAQRSTELLYLAAAGWIVAFAGFATIYGPFLTSGRRKSP